MQRTTFRFLICLAALATMAAMLSASVGPSFAAPGAEDGSNVEFISQIGGTSLGIAAQGGYAYMGDGPRLAVLDVSDPAQPVLEGLTDAMAGVVHGVAVAGSYAYVAGGYGGLNIIDVSDPSAPVEVGSVPTDSRAMGVAVAGSYAYLGDEGTGLHVIDVSDPAAPFETGLQLINGGVTGVAVDGDYVYVATGSLGLKIIDVSDPYAPNQTGWWDSPGFGLGVAAAGGYAYLADAYKGIRIVDVTDPYHPNEVGYNETPGYAEAVAVSGGYAYVADGSEGLRIHDVSDPYAPFPVGFAEVPGSAWDVAVVGGNAYVADVDAGLRVIDPSDPSAPVEAGYYDIPPAQAASVAVAGNYAYVPGYGTGLHIIDVSDPYAASEVGAIDTAGNANDVAVSSGHAFVADGYEGLRVIDVSNPSAPFETGYFDTPGYAAAVEVSGDYAYVADQSEGLRIIDVSNPIDPFEAGYFDSPWNVFDVALGVDHAYVAEYEGLRVLDVSNPAAPFETDWYDTQSHGFGVATAGGYVYLANWDNGLRIFDVSDPTDVVEVSLLDTPGYARRVALSGLHAYIADMRGGLRIIDVSDPAAPFEDGYYDWAGDAHNVTVSQDIAYVADWDGGMHIVRYTGNVSTVSGNVHDEGGLGIQGVVISDDQGHFDMTDATGDFEILNVEPGTYTFVASKQHYLFDPPTAEATVPPDAIIEFTGTLNLFAVSGHVLDEGGSGLEGVAVSDDGGAHFDVTDGNGYFHIPDVEPGTYTFVATKQGYQFSPPVVEVTVPPDASGVDFVGSQDGDVDPPAAISNFRALVTSDPGSLELAWTAPGDDGDVGTATSYVVRYASSSIESEPDWEAATDVSGEPDPLPAGFPQSMEITGLPLGEWHNVAIRALDEAMNLSPLSASPGAIDLGFRSDTDGYGFPNKPEVGRFLPEEMQRMFGDECVCWSTDDGCTFKISAWMWYEDYKPTSESGLCDGMSTSSLRIFSGVDSLTDGRTTHDQSIDDAVDVWWNGEASRSTVQDQIGFLHTLQRTQPVKGYRNAVQDYSPTQIVSLLTYHMKDGISNPAVVSVRPWFKGGHTVTPFAVENHANGLTCVRVYDSNSGQDPFKCIFVDMVEDTWQFSIKDGEIWSGDSDSGRLTYVPISEYDKRPNCPFFPFKGTDSAPAGEVRLAGGGHLLITDSQGRNLGYVSDEFVDEIPGAFGSFAYDGLSFETEPVYTLPLTETFSTVLDGQTLAEPEPARVTQFGPGYVAVLDGIQVWPLSKERLTVAPDGTRIAYGATVGQEMTLATVLASPTEEHLLQIEDADVGNDQFITLTASVDTGQLIFSSDRAAGGEYGVRVTRLNAERQSDFWHTGIDISASDTHYFDYGDWDGDGPMTLHIDHGSDGTMDETVELENHANRVYLPVVLRGD